MFVGLHFLYLWLPRWLWAEAILWWLEKSDSSIWGRSGGLLPPRGYPNYPCFVQISRQRHLCASSERSKTFGHCVLAQRYCCQKSSHTTLESYTLSVTCQVRTKSRVSVQGVESLGGHFACLCREFDFYEVKTKKKYYYFSKRNWKYFYTFNHFCSEKSSKRAK